MRSRLILEEGQREKFKNDVQQIRDLFFERIEPIFADAENEAETYTEKLNEEVGESINWGGDNAPDPEDAEEAVWDAGVERYKLLSTMRNRTLVMWISCMCQVWEQQLHSFILHEALMEGITYDEKFKGSGFKFIQDVLMWHDIKIKKFKSWKYIYEMRLLVNAVKHGPGDSEKKLRAIRPDFFNNHGFDVMKFRSSTLLEDTLQVHNDDFDNYYKAIIDFWNEFPEEAYSDAEFIES